MMRLNSQRLFEAAFASAPTAARPPPEPTVEPLEMQTYPVDWFVPDQPAVEQLTCPICLNGVRDPPNLETCGCLICRICLEECRQRKNECPIDRSPFPLVCTFVSNSFVNKLVWRLCVRCTNHEDGCQWADVFGVEGRNLAAHHLVCPKRKIKCELCEPSHLVAWDDALVHIRIAINSPVNGLRALAHVRRLMPSAAISESQPQSPSSSSSSGSDSSAEPEPMYAPRAAASGRSRSDFQAITDELDALQLQMRLRQMASDQ